METPKRVVLDTDVMVDHLRGKGGGVVESLEGRAELATTVVNAFELYYGAYKSRQASKNLAAAKNLLSTLSVLLMDDSSAERAGEVLATLGRERRGIDSRDLFVGCVAVQHGYAVVTNNREHFGRIPGLQVLPPDEFRGKVEPRR